MAATSSHHSPFPPNLLCRGRLDTDSIRELVLSIDQYIFGIVSDISSWKSLKLKSTSRFEVPKQDYFEFSEQSVLSNLYWGIENIEIAVQASFLDERSTHLESAEQMLQIPALLAEHGKTGGVANRYLVCSAYFYLSLVRKLQQDEWQMALHFLQAVLVSPQHVRKVFAPGVWEKFLAFEVMGRNGEVGSVGNSLLSSLVASGDAIDIEAWKLARRYKDQMMYYQVVFYAETPRWIYRRGDGHRCYEELPNSMCVDSVKANLELVEQGNSLILHDERTNKDEITVETLIKDEGSRASEVGDREKLSHCSILKQDYAIVPSLETYGGSIDEEDYELNSSSLFSSRSQSTDIDIYLSILEQSVCPSQDYSQDVAITQSSLSYDFRSFKNISDKLLHEGSFRNKVDTLLTEVGLYPEDNSQIDMLGKFGKAVSTLWFAEGLRKCEDAGLKLSNIWNILKNKNEGKYDLLKEVMFAEMLDVILISKEEKVVKTLVTVLLLLISADGSFIEDIRRKDSYLRALANGINQNVCEAATLVYLLSPSQTELKDSGIFPALVEVACNAKSYGDGSLSFPLTPATASMTMIKSLLTNCDYEMENMHLTTIISPEILVRLMNSSEHMNLVENASLISILVSYMRLDGNCRNYISTVAPFPLFIHLLKSNNRNTKYAALEFFHEILLMPRSSAVGVLREIRKLGNINIMYTLLNCIQQAEIEYRLLAANLLLQLDMMENANARSIFREEALEVLLESVAAVNSSSAQALSAFIFSNLGGTYAWTGEPYTVAWLLKKTGLTPSHRNMIKNFDWSDPCLQDPATEVCCCHVVRSILKIGNSAFQALEKGLKSNIRTVSRDCLTAIAWLGCEVAKIDPNQLRYFVSEILLGDIVCFLHPELELDERLLSCLFLYSYASGKGLRNLVHFSEGLRESLKHLSTVTWMAEELLKVTNYIIPAKSHVSCVHRQIVEAGRVGYRAVSSLIYYKGQLYSGHSDGSIKVWDLKGQTTKLVREVKMHKKAVTCFALYEPGDSLLSGSADKTVRVWRMARKKLECLEVIDVKEGIHKIDTCGQMIFIVTQNHGVKACNTTRNICTISKTKHAKSIAVSQGKIYIGFTDASVKELDIVTDEMREIKAPIKSWWMHKRPVYSIVAYKDWIYSASDSVQGLNISEWRKHKRTGLSTKMQMRTNVLALAVVEDFMYLNCSSSPTILQIWLREKNLKLGRLSAGSKITSVLSANDIVLCGTQTGLIKGWIRF